MALGIKNRMWEYTPQHVREAFQAAYILKPGQLSKGSVDLIRAHPIYVIWKDGYMAVSAQLGSYVKKHIPDLNATELAEAVGRQGKRHRPGRVRGSRSRSLSVSDMRRSGRDGP